MTDMKANVDIKFDFMGKQYEYKGYINWFVDSDDGIDSRVREFFRESYDDGIERYRKRIADYHKEQAVEDERKRDLAELARLKEKYEPD